MWHGVTGKDTPNARCSKAREGIPTEDRVHHQGIDASCTRSSEQPCESEQRFSARCHVVHHYGVRT